MQFQAEREAIIESCLQMCADNLTLGTSGNISIRVGDLVAISPSGVPYPDLTPEMIPIVDLHGNLVEGVCKPSSETPLHTLIYRETDAQAIVHTHPVYGVVLGSLRTETPLIHYMVAPMGGAVRVAPYAQFGTQELADNVLKAADGRSGVLMENHGAITWGKDLATAYSKAKYLEWCCEVWCKAAMIGDPHLLTADQVQDVINELANYSPNLADYPTAKEA